MLLLTGLVAAPGSVRCQRDLWDWSGSFLVEVIGHASFAGDVDADGFADVIMARELRGGRRAIVRSGRDGSVLIDVPQADRRAFGAGDANADGHADIVVGESINSSHFATLISGADASVLWRVQLPGANRLAGAGDTNGDGFDDVIGGNLQAVTIYSGRDGAVLRQIPDRVSNPNVSFGLVIDGAGDVDGDGFDDVLVASGAYTSQAIGDCQVSSGRDGHLIWAWTGAAGDEGFWAAAGAGDVNADGYADVVAMHRVNYAGRVGEVFVYSGFDGSVIHVLQQPNTAHSLGYGFGQSLARAGDVNGDGFADVLVGAPGTYGGAVVYSGRDGSIIHQMDALGHVTDIDGGHDVDGDGFDDIVVSNPIDTSHYVGRVRVIDVGAAGTPGRERFRGASCGSSLSVGTPRIVYRGSADLGTILSVRVRGARAHTGAVLHFGNPVHWPLGVLGLATPCALLADAMFVAGAGTAATGMAELTLAIPPDLAPIGFEFGCQWAIWDPGANPLGVSLSDSLWLKIGVRP